MEETPQYLNIRPLTYRKACEQMAVLASQNIACEMVSVPGGFRIHVDGDLEAARNLLSEVESEDSARQAERSDEPPFRVPVLGLLAGGAVFAFFAWFPILSQNPLWYPAGIADAEKIRAGEWWRTVTCLLLHADAGHLLSNVLFMAVGAGAVMMMTGPGVGWLAILLSGVAGSFLNAAFRPEHLSLGSSTAVFGAYGILAGLRFFHKHGLAKKAFWVALGGAVSMLAFFGMDTKTDIGAHVFGFVSGIALGAVLSFFLSRKGLPSMPFQAAASVVTLILIVVSWLLALRII